MKNLNNEYEIVSMTINEVEFVPVDLLMSADEAEYMISNESVIVNLPIEN